MDTAPEQSSERTAPDFYIPAASIRSARGTVESVMTRVFGGHGRVPIPVTYNK